MHSKNREEMKKLSIYLGSLTLLFVLMVSFVQAQNIPQANKNYTIEEVYDENGVVISYIQTYTDKLGRPEQVQRKDLEDANVIVQQSIYDQFGRPALTTLAAPAYTTVTDNYLSSFMRNAAGNNYGINDFDLVPDDGSTGEQFNPNTVNAGTKGTLGWYYSNNNNEEAYVPFSAHPYLRSVYADNLRQNSHVSALAGEDLKMGSGHEKKIYLVEQGKELQYITGLEEPVFKSLNVDPEGLVQITYTNALGNVLAQCYSGLDMGACSSQVVRHQIQFKNERALEKSFVEVHIADNANSSLKLIKNALFTDNYTYCDPYPEEATILFVLEDLLTGKKLVEGVDYSVNASTGLVSFQQNYVNTDRFLKVSVKHSNSYIECVQKYTDLPFPLQTVEVSTDYSNWTLYRYNNNQQLIAKYPPSAVDCWSNAGQGPLPTTYDSEEGWIAATEEECNVSETPVSLASTTFDNFDYNSNSGEYKFKLNFLAFARDFPSCITPPSCDYFSFSNSSANMTGQVGGGNEFHHNFEEQDPIESTYPDGYEEDMMFGGVMKAVFEQENSYEQVSLEETPEESAFGTLYQQYGGAGSFSSEHLFPYSSYQNTYNRPQRMGGSIPAGGNSGDGDLSQQAFAQWLNDVLGKLYTQEDWDAYCRNTSLSCNDGRMNCDETGIDAGGHCATQPCNSTYHEWKRRGSFKLTLRSEGDRRDGGGWEPVALLSDNYNDAYAKIADETPTTTRDYIFTLEYDCACNYLLKFEDGPTDMYGVLDQQFLSTYKKVRFRLSDVKYAQDHGGYLSLYYPVDFSNTTGDNVYQVLGRGIGLEFNGRLEQEVGFVAPTHTESAKTAYTYNDQGQLSTESSPDEGTKEYYYDEFHRLQYWRTAEQTAANQFSYLVYDDLGRIEERGVLSSASLPSQPLSNYTRSEQHFIEYDKMGTGFPVSDPKYANYEHNFLKGKVSKTSNDKSSTWYGYDQRGRLKWTMQYINDLAKYFTINYFYHQNGNVFMVAYQLEEGGTEMLIHRYSYDANARLIKVETSEDNANFTEHAEYSYYQHGPLKRVEMGNDLQGIDYVYTINGWLKSINNPVLGSRDPGKDGESGSPNVAFEQDIFGMSIDYFRHDYVRDGTGIQSYSEHYYEPLFNPTTGSFVFVLRILPSQYDGSINTVRWRTRTEVNPSAALRLEGKQLAYIPQYDERKRLVSAQFARIESADIGVQNTGQTVGPNVYDGPSPQSEDDYKLWGLSYDLDGNLSTLKRNGSLNTEIAMDDLSFNRTGNRLTSVSDAEGQVLAEDIGNQGSNNYSYDASGRIVGDVAGNNYLNYNSSNLPLQLYRNSSKSILKSALVYDERGQRLSKSAYTLDGSGTFSTETSRQYYIRDVAGNLFAVVNQDLVNSTTETENLLHGLGQLGFYKRSTQSTTAEMRYQLTDHLGNVRAMFGGNRLSGDINLLSAQDYYPFGAPMPERTFTSSSFYKEGYQGQPEDEETGFNAFELRLYDARIGSWLSPDPYQQYHSPYKAMSNNPFSFIDPNGGLAGPSGSGFVNYSDPLNGRGWSEINSDLRNGFNPVNTSGGGGGGRPDFGALAAACPSCSGDQVNRLRLSWGSGREDRVVAAINAENQLYRLGFQYTDRAGGYDAKGNEVTLGYVTYRFYESVGDESISQGILKESSLSTYRVGSFSRTVAMLGVAWSAIDVGTNHRTYTTTKGQTKNIYKPNGKVRSAKAAQAARTSQLVRGVSYTLAGVGIAIDGIGVYNYYFDDDPESFKVHPAKFGLNLGMTILGVTGGPVTAASVGTFFLIDATIGWENGLNSARRIEKQNQAILGDGWRITGNGLK
jgi:RHS repeat-associated protein